MGILDAPSLAPVTVAATTTTAGPLALSQHTPVDTTAGSITMTLPTPKRIGDRLRVEKADATANTVIVSGTIRGAAGTVTLYWQYETIELVAESLTSWRPTLGHKTKTALDGAYERRLRTLANLLGRTYEPLPATNPSPPTIAHASTTTLTRVWSAQLLLDRAWAGSLRGAFGSWNQSYGRVDLNAKPVTIDFWVDDTQVELDWVEATANGARLWTWVDGAPAEAPPSAAPLTTSSGGTYSTLLTWPARGRHRVTINAAGLNALLAIRTNVTGWIAAANRRPRIAIVGDSYIGGSNASAPPNGIADVIARTLDADVLNEGAGGTGYANPGPSSQVFGHTARVARVATFKPDLIVFAGSINDQSYAATAIQSGASAAFAAYAAACPGVPQIVFGVQPTNANATLSSTMAAAANAVYQAANAATNVIAFYDEIGFAATGTVPATWVAYTAYTTGQIVAYQGAIYKWLGSGNGGPNNPTVNNNWELLSWGYTGTGNTGSTTGDGTRDVFVYGADNTHPTIEAAYFAGLSKADAIVRALRTSAGQQP